MATTKDYYATLGVGMGASQDAIKRAYRQLAKKHHPDANQNDPKAAERFKEISEAYQVLGDAEKRKHYDEMRRLGAFDTAAEHAGARRRPPGGASAGGAGQPGPGQPGSFKFEDFDIGGLGGLGDLFGSIFNQQRGGATKTPQPGQSVETTLEVPFHVAATGGKVPVDLELTEECGTCSGSGNAPGTRPTLCRECGGLGTVNFGQGGFAVSRPCPACLGRGNVPSKPCGSCNGTGEVRAKKKILITVPPGADTGTKVRLKGQGGKGINGGPAGDVMITFQVREDPAWSREGLDLVRRVPINVAQATLGSKTTVQTIDGKTITLRIPPGTASGKRFRITKQGIHKGDKLGDLIAEIAIEVPSPVTAEQEKLMKQFAEAAGLSY
ncbi:MAG: J domain-containing protein [Gemmatimonadetes bacterium]|nr:J domain-containing protein [Gemmatimonadota bacterium]